MRQRWANHLGNEDRNIYTLSHASIHKPSTLESFLASIEELGSTNAIFESRSHFMEGVFVGLAYMEIVKDESSVSSCLPRKSPQNL